MRILHGMRVPVRYGRTVRGGVTLLEVLLLLVAVALAAAFALPQWRAYGVRARAADLRDALRRLAVAEDSYHYDFGVYTDELDRLAARGLSLGAGIRVRVVEATRVGWSAAASLPGTPVECAIYVKAASPVGPATEEGEIACG